MSSKRKKAATAAKLAKDKMACNKPKRTPKHPTKSHVVKACKDGKEKIIRFGQQGVKPLTLFVNMKGIKKKPTQTQSLEGIRTLLAMELNSIQMVLQ